MSNSSLVVYTKLSPNKSSRNGNKIDRITPHHMAGVLSIETCGNVFAPSSRQASSNYGIGPDGRVGLYVNENERAWTSSSAANDRRAVTIEVANSAIGGNWPVSEAAWNSLVNLCTDICQRNGIPGLVWTGTTLGSITNHDMFKNTNCPGPYLKGRMGELADEVNKRLKNGWKPSAPTNSGSSTSTPSIPGKISEDGIWGNNTTLKLQSVLGMKFADGIISGQDMSAVARANKGGLLASTFKAGVKGSPTIRALQKKIGAKEDGYMGPDTFKKLQSYLGTTVDGYASKPSAAVRALQKRLNAGSL